MTGKLRYYVILIVLLAGVSMLVADNRSSRPPVPRRPDMPAQEVDPYHGRAVLVEAFVVEVDLAMLYARNVNPLGQAPHSVSVEDLQACLEGGDKAAVLVGAKAAALHKAGRNAVQRKETIYYPRTKRVNTQEGRQETTDYSAYDEGETLSITPAIVSERVVQVTYAFSYSGPREAEEPRDAPRDTVAWEWEGTTSLTVGQPQIVGATQDDKNAVFFLLTAHILD